MGAPPEVIAAVIAKSGPAEFEVLEENWESVNFFLRACTQWNCSQGVVIGLNYMSVAFLMDVLQVKDRESILTDLQIMEFAAVKAMNEKE